MIQVRLFSYMAAVCSRCVFGLYVLVAMVACVDMATYLHGDVIHDVILMLVYLGKRTVPASWLQTQYFCNPICVLSIYWE